MDEPTAYRSFLIRVWPRRARGESGACLTILSVATGRRESLPDVQSLVAFLGAEAEAPSETQDPQPLRDDSNASRTGARVPMDRPHESTPPTRREVAS